MTKDELIAKQQIEIEFLKRKIEDSKVDSKLLGGYQPNDYICNAIPPIDD